MSKCSTRPDHVPSKQCWQHAINATLSEQCNPAWQPESAKGNGWNLDGELDESVALEFNPNFNTSGVRHIHYLVMWNGSTLQHGEFVVYSHRYPPTDIYEGTDAFINYCIDKTKKLYSHNLKLFCIEPAVTDNTLSIRRGA